MRGRYECGGPTEVIGHTAGRTPTVKIRVRPGAQSAGGIHKRLCIYLIG
jgi:hypothetical protein